MPWAQCLQVPVPVRRKMIVGGRTSGYAFLSAPALMSLTLPQGRGGQNWRREGSG